MNPLCENLREIQRRIAMIEDFAQGGREAFLATPMIQESVIRCYEVIGEVVKKLDEPLLMEKHPEIDWKAIKGFRDFLIHSYDRVSVAAVWQAVESDLPALKQAVAAMLLDSAETDQDEAQG